MENVNTQVEVNNTPVSRRGRPVGSCKLKYTFRGKRQTLKEWSAELGITYHTLYQRIKIKGLEPRAAFHRARYQRHGRA